MAFGNLHGSIGKCGLRFADELCALIKVEQRPHGDAAVDDVFAVIASVVPAARDIQAVGTTGARRTRDAFVRKVARGTRQLRLARVGHLNRRARSVLVKVRQPVVLHLAIDAGADVEGMAAIRADYQREALAGALESREVDDVDMITRRHVQPRRLRFAKGRFVSVASVKLPIELLLSARPQGRDLGEAGVVADLIDKDFRFPRLLRLRRPRELRILQANVVDANHIGTVRSLSEAASQVKRELGAGVVLAALAELAFEPTRRLVDLGLLEPIFGVGRALHADLRPNLRRLRCPGAKADGVLVPSLERHLAMADLGIPRVLAAVVDAQAEGTVLDTDCALRGLGERRRPRKTAPVFECRVRNQVVRVDGDVARNGGEFT